MAEPPSNISSKTEFNSILEKRPWMCLAIDQSVNFRMREGQGVDRVGTGFNNLLHSLRFQQEDLEGARFC